MVVGRKASPRPYGACKPKLIIELLMSVYVVKIVLALLVVIIPIHKIHVTGYCGKNVSGNLKHALCLPVKYSIHINTLCPERPRIKISFFGN